MTTWKIDNTHSEITFKVKHMMISTVTGHFRQFDCNVETETDDFGNAKIYFDADINSIDTGVEQRDVHLKSDDFFNAEAFPKMIFNSKELIKSDDGFKLIGDLQIRDIKKEITLDVEFGGLQLDPWGNTRAGFEITGKVNRFDYNLKWNAVTEAGGIVVSDQVRLVMNVELIKQQ